MTIKQRIRKFFGCTPMTKREILEEGMMFYHENPDKRGIQQNVAMPMCVYKDELTGNKCFAGRCMSEDALDFIFMQGIHSSSVEDIKNKYPGEIFLPQYTGHDTNFWRRCQIFHDNSSYWNKDGITKEGLYFYKNFFNDIK